MMIVKGSHIEGTEFKLLARVVSTAGELLNPISAGPLLVEVFKQTLGGRLLYSNTITSEALTGIQGNGQTGEGWTQGGVWNFAYVWSPAQLLLASPPFAFKAPGKYIIRYSFLSPTFGTIKLLHEQDVIPG
jgi:hypothetical protein